MTPFSPRALDRALFAVTAALSRLGHDFMIRDQEAQKILEHSGHLDDVADTIAQRARLLKTPGSTDGPLEHTEVYHKVRGLLDVWHAYAEDLSHEHVSLNYTTDKLSMSRNLIHEMLDPKLVNLSQSRQQFKAPRSMRDVEANVALLPRLFNRTDGMMVPLAWVDEQTGLYEGQDFDDPSKTRKFSVVPIRFIRPCKNGHMADIDWRYFVHLTNSPCSRNLWLDDMGATGELTDLRVRCECGVSRLLSEAAGKNNPALPGLFAPIHAVRALSLEWRVRACEFRRGAHHPQPVL